MNQRMIDRVSNPEIRRIVQEEARSAGIDERVGLAMVGIESGGNPRLVSPNGNYFGLLQLSHQEFNKYNSGGSIYDARANARAGFRNMAAMATEFETKHGRAPTPTELYLAHQQGRGGLDRHLSNMDGSAVGNMASTGEGRRKGRAWAERAIHGNVPSDMRHLFTGERTSRQFGALWAEKVQGIPYAESMRARANVFGAYGPEAQSRPARQTDSHHDHGDEGSSMQRTRTAADWVRQFDPTRMATSADYLSAMQSTNLRNGRLPQNLLGSIGQGHFLAGPAADAFTRMQRAAAIDGIQLGINSSYRTIEDQQRMVRMFGLYRHGGRAAAPGSSNHGWGKSVDLDVKNRPDVLSWLNRNARRFQFVNDVAREPWHWTFQG